MVRPGLFDDAYRAQRRSANWIQLYIFLGGVLPLTGGHPSPLPGTQLLVAGVKDIRDSDALTQWTWRERFFARIDEVRAMSTPSSNLVQLS